jgi:NADPH-dependent dioxygenase
MSKLNNPEVLISGAGPVGLFAALALSRRGIAVAIADKGWRAGTHSYALALHPQSLGLLQEVGLLDLVMRSAHPVRSIGLYDAGGRRAGLELDGFPGSWSSVAVLRQDLLEDLFESTLRDMGVPVMWSHEVFGLDPNEDVVATRMDRFEKDSMGYSVARTEWVLAHTDYFDVPFVIGADGHRSRVRRALKMDYPEVAPAQHYAVFEFQTGADLGNEMRLVFGDNTTDVLWPLPGGYCRWSFELPDYRENAERQKDRLIGHTNEFPALTPESLNGFIDKRAPWFTGAVGEITWRNVVRFEKRLASAFGRGRLFLAGDAAHLTGPAGVQSMNLGLCEAYHLSELLEGVLRRGEPLRSLQAYNDRWFPQWRTLLGLDAELRGGSSTDPWVASCAPRLLQCLPAYGDELPRLVSQLGLTFAASASV